MPSKVSPGLILHNGRITTLDPNCPEATSIAVSSGRILSVGDAANPKLGPNTKTINLAGRRVIPGLNDSYLHVIRGGLNYQWNSRGMASLLSCMDCECSGNKLNGRRPVGGCEWSAAGASFNSPSAGCRRSASPLEN